MTWFLEEMADHTGGSYPLSFCAGTVPARSGTVPQPPEFPSRS